MAAQRPSLPIDAALPAIRDAVQQAGAFVLVAPPGAGKTTRVPPALLDFGVEGRVVLLQPRRVAARLCARRIASERGSRLGGEVGYQVRFDRRIGPDTRIEVLTEGLLLRRLQADPFLDGVGAVLLDEFHERSLTADLSLALLREVRAEARPDLWVGVMSATLDPGPVAAFLGGCPTIRAEGRRYPVTVEHDAAPDDGWLPERMARAVRDVLARTESGHVLCFLPGVGEIRRTQAALEGLSVPVLPLHGRLPPGEQDHALAPCSHRKVVLATNIAETSVTLDGVVAVVDGGVARSPRFDPVLGVERLETIPISVASADQRAGRAGRTGPGLARRLWTDKQHRLLPDADPPEVARLDLSGAALELLLWGADPRTFPWFEAPPSAALDAAMELLSRLGATDQGALTPIGREMAALPVHPRLARVVVEGRRRGCLRAAAGAAALVSERDPWDRDRGALAASGRGDLQGRLELLDARGASGAHRGALDAVRKVRDQLTRVAGGPAGGAREADVVACLVAGFPDRVGQRRAVASPRVRLASGTGAELDPPDQAPGADLLLAAQLTLGRGGLKIRLAARVEPDALPVRDAVVMDWDADRDAVSHHIESRFGALVLATRRPQTPADPARVSARLLQEALLRPDGALDLNDRYQSIAGRLRFLGSRRPDLDLPDPSPAVLLPRLCAGRRSFAQLRAIDLAGDLLGGLTWAQRQALDQLAPPRLTLPTGSTAAVSYGDADQPPVLAARIQQLFGLDQTPSVMGGREPVLLHLLAPNNRPAQVTQDLPGFWRGSYADVRKDLRGRYPKHDWPEDPWSASPQDRPRRRR